MNFCFCSFLMSLFPRIFVPLSFSLCMESTSYVFPFQMVFFYLETTGWIFDIILAYYVRMQSINQWTSFKKRRDKSSFRRVPNLLCTARHDTYVWMYGHTYSKSMDQPGKVASPARGHLNKKKQYFPVLVRA